MKTDKIILFFFVFILPFCVFGQKNDSLSLKYDSIRVISFSIQKIDTTIHQEINTVNIDTNLNYFQYNDPIRKAYLFNSNVGNTGLASENIVFAVNQNLGFSYGIHSFDAYRIKESDQIFYYSVKPFTDLFYTIGPKKEHLFHVTHLHSIKNKVFLGVNYQIVGSPGRDYFQQKASDQSVSVFSYYATKNKKYGVYANYIYNREKVQENGGLQNDTAYILYRQGDNSYSPTINLAKAGNKLKENAFVLKQYYSFEQDSSDRKNDSVPVPKSYNLGRLINTFSFSKEKQIFTDNELYNGFFPMIPFDTNYTADSVMFYHIDNTLAWTNNESTSKDKRQVLRYFAGLTYSYSEVHQMNATYFINVLKPTLGFTIKPYKSLLLNVNGEYVLFDVYNKDFKVSFDGKQEFDAKGKQYGAVELKAWYGRNNPDWFYEHYYSKYYQWDYDFLKQQTLYAGFNYSYKRLSVGLDYYNLVNYVYMDAYSRPKQYANGSINVLSAYLFKNFVMGKFEIDSKVVYQYNDKNRLLRTPEVAAMQSYFFSTHMFKKALFAQLGIDLLYNTKYYADGYNPAVRSFYLQNQAETGNYLYADVFLNFKVKRLRAYLKLTNILSGLIGYENFDVPHYPTPDRIFNFGVSWLFHD